jgi:ABC-type lipoprotein export system ATPase subunit
MSKLQEYIDELESKKDFVAHVSLKTPLLSNLNIVENIALIQEVHLRVPRIESHRRVLELFNVVNIQKIAQYSTTHCSDYEKFAARLIRASMMQYATIIIISPLQQFFSKEPIDVLVKLILDLKLEKRVEILDLTLYENDYTDRGLLCHIVK